MQTVWIPLSISLSHYLYYHINTLEWFRNDFIVFWFWFFTCLTILLLLNFSHQLLMVTFSWSLCDSKSPQVFKILLSDFNNAVVSIVLILYLISNFPSLIFRLFKAVPRIPTPTGIIIIFTFYSFFYSLARSKY